jgi:hypothetical protein
MAKKNFYFAKVKYNYDFCTYSSLSLTYSHIYTVTLITLRSYSNAYEP